MNLKFKEWLAENLSSLSALMGDRDRDQPSCPPGLTQTKRGCMKVLKTDPASGMWIGIIDGKHVAVHKDEISLSDRPN